MSNFDYEKVRNIKGFVFLPSDCINYREEEIEKTVSVPHDYPLKVRRKIIKDLSEYVKYVEGLPYSVSNPIFFRGQANANYYPLPSSLRRNVEKESDYFHEFKRRFPRELSANNSTIEQLVLMQHYEMYSRVMDLTEDPFIALFFACYYGDNKADNNNWGEVTLVRNPDTMNGVPDDIKFYDDNTTSIIANCMKMPAEFSLESLTIAYKNDGHQAALEGYINFIDIVCRSVIIRTPRIFERIQTQKGAFVLSNCNEVKFAKPVTGITENEFTRKIIEYSEKGIEINFENLKNGDSPFGCKFKNFTMRDFIFRKVTPFEQSHPIEKFRYNPFNFNRLLLAENNVQTAIVIAPDKKDLILNQLKRFGYTKSSVYPEFVNVCHYLRDEICNGN